MGRGRGQRFHPYYVRNLARIYDYLEIPMQPREARYMLSFEPHNMRGCGGTEREYGYVRINVYFTTGKVATVINHPSIPGRQNQLYRTIQEIEMLENVFSNPRYHTNTGYRRRN